MTSRLTALIAMTLFAAACSGGNGATSTTGASSGGATTGAATTTGGTTGKLHDGAACSANVDCNSGVCGLNGSGNCCSAACGGDGGACDATSCDNHGACTFPSSGTSCKADSCGAAKLTAYVCDGVGSCAAQSANTCSQHFGCTSDGTACATACTKSSECAQNYVCNAGVCVGAKTVGSCTENDDCFSGHCGLDGGGNCCLGATACVSGDATCGATDCDPTNGNCNYAGSGTACGSVLASCQDDVGQGASACDGKGACTTPGPAACAPFICGGNACLASCTDSSSCGAGDFCDTDHSSCCTALAPGASITVDGTAGNDATPCCSVPGHLPCLTITEAMKQIDAAQAHDVTINAVLHTGKTWAPPSEVYPIVLGWGAELSAPNIFFFDGTGTDAGAGNLAIFGIQAVSQNDTVGYASIVGSSAGPVTIGDDEFRDQSSDPSIIKIAGGSTLYLANAQLDSTEFTQNTAITIAAGGSLVMAQDQPGSNLGTVTIGYSDTTRESEWGYAGIVCQSSKTAGCTISDTVLDGGSSLVIQGQTGVDIDAEDFANVTLTGNPLIGIPAGDAGFGVCFDKVEAEDSESGAAILLHGTANATFDNGFIQCVSGDAFALTASKNGTPTLVLGNTTIENVNTAVDVFAGTATVSGSTIEFNGNGVAQTTDGTNFGTVHLNGGDAGNTIICSDSQEANGNLINFQPGTDVSNNTPNALDADNVTWDTAGPDVFRCDAALETCTCQIASCTISTADGGVDGMDAVEIGDAGVISTAGHQLSSAACNFPPPEPPPPVCNPPCVGLNVCCPFIRPVQCVPFMLCG